jgi:hypothetical protein
VVFFESGSGSMIRVVLSSVCKIEIENEPVYKMWNGVGKSEGERDTIEIFPVMNICKGTEWIMNFLGCIGNTP